MIMNSLSEHFVNEYGAQPEAFAFCPYRVCPLGAHIDHNLGKVMGFAVDRGVTIAYTPTESGEIKLRSLQFDEPAKWNTGDKLTPAGDWADHLRGALTALKKNHEIKKGLVGVIEGTLPIGGISSSAAVIIAFLSALCRVNSVKLTPREMILTAQSAESDFVGVRVGKLDQSCEVLCRREGLLYLDTADDSFEILGTPDNMPPFSIGVFFSGMSRSLAGSGYNTRVDELKSAASALKAYEGVSGTFADTVMRQVSPLTFEKYGDRLPEIWRRRAAHYFGESERVEKGAGAWLAGDLKAFGRLVTESGRSSVELWETGSPELKELSEILVSTPGVYGARFSGAGFKGSCIAIVDPEREESIRREVTERYCAAFPENAGSFSVCFCRPADGAEL